MLMVCFGLVGGLAVASAALRTFESAALRSDLVSAGQTMEVLRLTLSASEQLSVEQSAASNAFAHSELYTPRAFLVAYDAARQKSAAALTEAAIRNVTVKGQIASISQQLDLQRRNMLASLAQDTRYRSDEAQRTFVLSITAAQTAINKLADGLERDVGKLSASLGQLAGLARVSQSLRETLGLRSALLFEAMQVASVPPQLLRQIDELGGASQAMWDRLRMTAAQMNDMPEIASATVLVATAVMDEGDRDYRALADALRLGQSPSMDANQFHAWSLPVLAKALLVRDAAFAAAAKQRNVAIQDADWRMGRDGLMALAALFVALVASLQVMRRVARPLSALTEAVSRIADGNLSVAVPGANRNDELGEVAAAMVVLRDRAAAAEKLREQLAVEQNHKIAAAASLTHAAQRFEEASSSALAQVSDAEAELSEVAWTIDHAAARTEEGAQGATESVAMASTAVTAVAEATEELAVSIRNVSERMLVTAQAADAAAKGADAAAAAVVQLSSTARRIENILQLIVSIAGRTNLLALNATIEAARAGTAGHGFAVVASEVKNLAAQTAKAAMDVGSDVHAILATTSTAMVAIKGLALEVGAVSGTTADVALTLQQQGLTTRRIAEAAQAAAGSTAAATSLVTGAALQTAATRSTAMRLPGVSVAVTAATGSIRTSINIFLAKVRTVA